MPVSANSRVLFVGLRSISVPYYLRSLGPLMGGNSDIALESLVSWLLLNLPFLIVLSTDFWGEVLGVRFPDESFSSSWI